MEKKIKTPMYIVLGSGGHTAEMCNIIKALLQQSIHPEYYKKRKILIAKTDNISKCRYKSILEDLNKNILDEDEFAEIPRSREVGQNWLSTMVTTFYALIWSFWLICKDQPHLILCNGPGTCVPICLAGFCCRFLSCFSYRPKIVYVESFCRVRTLSLSGKVLLRIADLFVVQWPPLAEKYVKRGNVKYFGNIM